MRKLARLAGLSRSAAYEWHNRSEEDGIEGLRDRPRPGRRPRVDAATSARFKERIVAGAELQRDGVVAFRAVYAQRILKEEFAIGRRRVQGGSRRYRRYFPAWRASWMPARRRGTGSPPTTAWSAHSARSPGLSLRPLHSCCLLPRPEIGDIRVQKFPEIRIRQHQHRPRRSGAHLGQSNGIALGTEPPVQKIAGGTEKGARSMIANSPDAP
jgi:transposase